MPYHVGNMSTSLTLKKQRSFILLVPAYNMKEKNLVGSFQGMF